MIRSAPMRELAIRRALLRDVTAQYFGDVDTLIIEELGLLQGRARIDLAVVNGHLHGFEIKSDSDTFERLPAQAAAYGSVMDYMTLVVGPDHADAAVQAAPDWWGVSVAQRKNGRVSLAEVRASQQNAQTDPLAVVQLLWRDEALALLEQVGAADGLRSRPREFIWRRLSEVCAPEFLAAAVRQQIKHRGPWRARA